MQWTDGKVEPVLPCLQDKEPLFAGYAMELVIDVEREIPESADQVWEILGDFSRYADLAPHIDNVELEQNHEGLLRHVDCGGRRIVHQLLVLDRMDRKVCFQVLRAPGIGPGHGHVSCVHTIPLSDKGCKVNWSTRIHHLPDWLPSGSENIFQKHASAVLAENLDHLASTLASRR